MEYRFVTVWRIEAPIEAVCEAISHSCTGRSGGAMWKASRNSRPAMPAALAACAATRGGDACLIG